MKFNWDSGCEQQQQQKETCSLAEASGFRRPHHSGFSPLSEILWPQRTWKLPTPSSASRSNGSESSARIDEYIPVCSMYGQGQMGGMRGEGTEEEQDAVALSPPLLPQEFEDLGG